MDINQRIIHASCETNYRFSFIVIVRNGERFLTECLKSIKLQTFRDYEVVIVDDDSSDRTEEIVHRNIEQNWTFIKVLENVGRARARNLAASCAKGEFLVIQDADDVSIWDRLKYIDEISKGSSFIPDVIVGKIRYIDDSGRLGAIEENPKSEDELKLLLSLGKMPVAHPATCIRRRTFLEVGGYPNYARAQDLALLIKMKDYNFVIDSRIHTLYRRKPIISYRNFKQSQLNVIQIQRDLLGIEKFNFPIFISWIINEFKRVFRIAKCR